MAAATLAVALFCTGCGADDANACDVDAASVTFRSNVQFVVYRYCVECHDIAKKAPGERRNAAPTHNYNTYALITRSTDITGQTVNLAQQMLDYIEDKNPATYMPPPEYGERVDACGVRLFSAWVQNGTPE